MVIASLRSLGLRSQPMYGAGLASVALCLLLWFRAKTVDQDERGNAERRAIFVGLWAPTLWSIARTLEEHE